MASITKLPNGRYRLRYRSPDGGSRMETFDKKSLADQRLIIVEGSKLTGAYVDTKAGRTKVVDYWKEWSARQPWRETSRLSVTSIFKRHILPAFGKRPLVSLKRGEIEAWGAKLELGDHASRQTMQYLSTMLDAAVLDGYLASNPARGAKRPKVDVKPIEPFTDELVDRLVVAAPDWFGVAMTLGLGAGLRQSEATGLTVDRVDFLRRTLKVDRQLVSHPAGEPSWGPPKSDRSYRAVPLADSVVAALARHVEEHGVGEQGVLVHGPDGRPVRRERFGHTWRRLREAAVKQVDADLEGESDAAKAAELRVLRGRLTTARFHDTRHTFASVLLSGGVSVAAAAEYLGHTPAVLLKTYAHLMPADHDRARSVVEEAFRRDASETSRVIRVSSGG